MVNIRMGRTALVDRADGVATRAATSCDGRRSASWALLCAALLAAGCRPTPSDMGGPRAPFVIADAPAHAARRNALSSKLGQVDAAVRDVVLKQRIPSLVVGLLVDGRLLWWGGYGTTAQGSRTAVDRQSMYRIGSLTKVITAMAVLRLRDEGQLALDAPAERYLPELRQVDRGSRDAPPITLRHLLTHTAGLPRVGNLNYARTRSYPVTEGEVLGSLRRLRLDHPPGVAHQYSNLGYALVGLIVARVSGMPYRQYVTKQVLMPLGMRSAVWDRHVISADRLVTGYAMSEAGYTAKDHWKLGAAEAMGGLYASLDDMLQLVAFQMTAWPPDGRPSLPPLRNASLRESQMLGGFQPAGPGSGLGWGVTNFGAHGQLAYHTGATGQYAATMMLLPKQRIGVVALTNCGCHADALGRLGRRMLRTLLK